MITSLKTEIADSMSAWRDSKRDPDRADAVLKALKKLKNPKHAAVVGMRFFDEMTLAECGIVMGVSPERVRQIEMAALKILSRELKRSGLGAPQQLSADGQPGVDIPGYS